ncbi:MAG: response regulator [Bdellovibrionaceae bacterium]|nr:response regulator [Pseudobdellovibrionaceae bacterium]
MKILIAEDDQNISTIAKLVLERVGKHEVHLVADGRAALDTALSQSFDLIILDGMMPELSGPEVCRMYKEQKQNASPVIFLSAKSTPQDIAQFLDLGVGYIQKPFNPQTLCQQIETILKAA